MCWMFGESPQPIVWLFRKYSGKIRNICNNMLHGFILATEWRRCSRQLEAGILSVFTIWTVLRMRAPLTCQRVKDYLSMTSSPGDSQWVPVIIIKHHPCSGLTLDLNEMRIIPVEFWLSSGFQNNYSAMLHRCSLPASSAARRPQTWC